MVVAAAGAIGAGFRLDESTDIRAQVGVFQTAEAVQPSLRRSRLHWRAAGRGSKPGWRFVAHSPTNGTCEIAPVVHVSTTHVAGTSVPSRLYSFDWSIAPLSKVDFSGMFFTGENIANLGTIRQGFTILGPRNVIPIHSIGGWGQLSYILTPRLTFNVYGGQHDDRNRDLRGRAIGKNFIYAANSFYKLRPT